MANYNYTMENLINDSIRVTNGMIEDFNVSEVVPKFPGRYATNNSTVAFVYEGNFFVTPYTRRAMHALKEKNFLEDYFYVPFSNGWCKPNDSIRQKWDTLREQAQMSYRDDFSEDCVSYCDSNHIIGTLSEKTMDNCFEMPSTGVSVKHTHYETTHMPVLTNRFFDSFAASKLGTFCCNNGRVVFVYRNGKTYVTRGYKIVSELKSAGFREDSLYVPFSNGEEILDSTLRAKWESIRKN